MNASTKRKIRKFFSPIKRIGLKNKSFSIISNNCWGGIVYDIFGLQYRSPTIGCYFFSKEYLLFIKDLKHYLSLPLMPVAFENSKYHCFYKKNTPVVLGRIGEVEIIFLHYSSFKEAKEKWERRSKRVNFSNLLIKYSDQNGFTLNDYDEFERLDYNKLFITGSDKIKGNDVVFLRQYQKLGFAKDDIKPSFSKINLKKRLNEIR